MNKFAKVILGISAVLVITGGIFSVAGLVAGGRNQLNELIGRDALTVPMVSYHEGNEYGEADYNLDFDDGQPMHAGDFRETLSGDVRSMLEKGTLSLDVDVSGIGFYICESDEDEFLIEGYNLKKAQYYVEDGVLYIKALDRVSWRNPDYGDGRVYVYLPRESSFDQAKIQVGAGSAGVDYMNAKELKCDVAAGSLYFSSMVAKEAEFDLGMGEIETWEADVEKMDFQIGMGSMNFSGKISGDVKGECDMGSMVMEVEGKAEDHNYRVEAAMGSIQIEGNSYAGNYSGMGVESDVNNGADSTFDLETSMGSIEIYFTNE